MKRTVHFRHFAVANKPMEQLHPEVLEEESYADLFFYRHVDLSWTVVDSNGDRAILVGIAFHIERTLTGEELLIQFLNSGEPLDELDHWTGNFALLHLKGSALEIYTDASACNKVYYACKEGLNWAGSDPMLYTYWQALEEKRDPSAREFYASKWFKNRSTLIADQTQYEGLYQLVANHKLIFNEGKAHRVFPHKKRVPQSIEEASAYIVPRIERVLGQILEQYDVSMALTAGWDSRLLMSASKRYSSKLKYYTFRRKKNSDSFPDIAIPLQMSKDLGFRYSIIDEDEDISGYDKDVISRSFSLVNPRRFSHFLTSYSNFDPKKLVLVGTVSEVGKNYLERIPVNTGVQAVRALHFVEHPYLIKTFEDWLAKNKKVLMNYGYEYMDFLHWEQDITNYAGAGIQYGNHVVNVVSLLNSRKILEQILSVDYSLRDKHSPRFYQYIVQQLWPELLDYPVNPFPREKKIVLAKKWKLYAPYKYLENRFKKRPFNH